MPLSDLVRTLLAKRGLTDSDAITAFLQPDYAALHAPELLLDMSAATARTLRAMAENERIAIYADFDCDGVPGAALLSDLFARLQYTNIEVYIPHRDREGYGFHLAAIDQLAARDVRLIITVDVGTTAHAAVDHARRLGVDVIVTDHHETLGAVPAACAVLNPKREPYPFKDLCGAGVAFKFAQALLSAGRAHGLPEFLAVPEGWEKWLLDLVAIATVADMVPLQSENRILVFWGLAVLRKSRRAGIAALCAELRLRKAHLTEDDIGFSIAPRINAASRMDSPELALALLTTTDTSEATRLAQKLEELNARRKGAVASIVRQARKQLTHAVPGTVVVLGDPEWKPALLGLAANSIMSGRGGAVCLWGRDGNGKLKGSCRSDGTLSVVDLFTARSDHFEAFGGHHASGGFTLVAEKVHTLPEALATAGAALQAEEKATRRTADALVTLREISPALFSDIARLAPFGIGNEKPLFLVHNACTVAVKPFGKDKNHLEVMLECTETNRAVRAFDFFRAADDFTLAPARGARASVLATIERDSFRGGIALRLVDIVSAG